MSTTRRMDAAARSPWWLVASMVVLLAASQAVGTPRPLGTARGGAGVALSAPGGLGTIVGERATFPARTRSLPPARHW